MAVASLVIAEVIRAHFAKESLEAQQEYNLRSLKMQLYHEDRKKAIIELNELLMKWYNSYPEFTREVRYFLNGKSGIFLPYKLRTELRKELEDIDEFLKFKELEMYGPEQEPEHNLDDYERWIEVSPQEAVDMEVKSRLGKLKRSMRDRIKKHASED